MSHNVIELSVVAYGLKNTKNNFKKHFEINDKVIGEDFSYKNKFECITFYNQVKKIHALTVSYTAQYIIGLK